MTWKEPEAEPIGMSWLDPIVDHLDAGNKNFAKRGKATDEE